MNTYQKQQLAECKCIVKILQGIPYGWNDPSKLHFEFRNGNDEPHYNIPQELNHEISDVISKYIEKLKQL